MKQRLVECAENAEKLVPLVLSLAESLGGQAEQGGTAHEQLERILALAMALTDPRKPIGSY